MENELNEPQVETKKVSQLDEVIDGIRKSVSRLEEKLIPVLVLALMPTEKTTELKTTPLIDKLEKIRLRLKELSNRIEL